MSDPATKALDEIAALCGVPGWEYPAQVVRDVRMLIDAVVWNVSEYKVLCNCSGRPRAGTTTGHHESCFVHILSGEPREPNP